jgi:AGCS family alanine or glycine:cation symporter
MENMQIIANIINDHFFWGLPLIILLVATGLYLTIILRGIQFTKLWQSLYMALVKRKEDGDQEGDLSHFQALMTALSATVGTGNIAGVATAIAVGGPGAMFWMWVTGLVGMATKYSEALLAVKYRITDEAGTMSGGPMYYISRGLGWKWLAAAFALFASIAAFGYNLVQANSIADVVQANLNIPVYVTGIVLAILVGLVIIGGIKNIGSVTGVLIPVMIVFYMGGALIILLMNIKAIPAAFALIFESAFTPTAASGGFLGAGVMMAIRMGVSRGIFSNESGLGSGGIAAASAQTKHPVSQALVSMTQTFIDTLVVCTMTGLVLILSGVWNSGGTGAALTSVAFKHAIPGGNYMVTVSLILFAYSTILGWCYYGEKSIAYLLGGKAVRPYRVVFIILVACGAVMKLELVWALADVFNRLMAIPNLIGLLALSPIIVKETRDYFTIIWATATVTV